DGIRDGHVTGVQTCALPIYDRRQQAPLPRNDQHCWIEIGSGHGEMTQHLLAGGAPVHAIELDPAFLPGLRHLAKQFSNLNVVPRSEERRVGKECRSSWSTSG